MLELFSQCWFDPLIDLSSLVGSGLNLEADYSTIAMQSPDNSNEKPINLDLQSEMQTEKALILLWYINTMIWLG